jgi:hypothetical protein
MRIRTVVFGQAMLLLLVATLLPMGKMQEAKDAKDSKESEEFQMSFTETPMPTGMQYTFQEDVDAVSFTMPSEMIDARVRGWTDDGWTPWHALAVEKEFDPLLTESNMVMFPRGVRTIELVSPKTLPIHPVHVSRAPVAHLEASQLMMAMPRILSRSEWGADPAVLIKGPETSRSDTNASGNEDAPAPSPSPKRVVDCNLMQREYPQEFKTVKTVRTDAEGNKLRWPQQYSPGIKLLVVHHTALEVNGDPRPPVERVRALYAYHANGRGWGDVGYNFIIDETGQIYEGRAGGSRVVAGHAYCHNVGTLGVALLGNAELEKPTDDQVSALQWLLHTLATTEQIDVDAPVTFHGFTTPAIVGHGDLVSTTCPGFYLRSVLDQIRRNVSAGKMYARVAFLSLSTGYVDKTEKRKAARSTTSSPRPAASVEEGVTAIGATLLKGRPGSQTIISVRYQAGERAKDVGTVAASVRVPEGVGLWQDVGNGFERVRDRIELPAPVPSRGTLQLRLKIQFPPENGRSTLTIGAVTYVLETDGRRLRGTTGVATASSSTSSTTSIARAVRPTRRSSSSRSSSSSSSRPRLVGRPASTNDGPTIRIRLGFADVAGTMAAPGATTVNGQPVDRGNLTFARENDGCVVRENGRSLANGVVRIDARGGIIAINSWERAANRFRGVLECRVVDGQLALINELPLEQYLRGLAEEPDTEPYEKQRAFAIAARSYAAYYIAAEGANRKFVGKPYDGSDDPATFQKYGGVQFEENNPRWTKAVDATALMVLAVNGATIKVPYFSQSDGRTLSPAEAGWTTFPNAAIFSSKPDPWCEGMERRGHGVGMSGCGAEAQANEGKSAEQILEYYYPGARRQKLSS